MVITSHAVGAVVVDEVEPNGRVRCAQMQYTMPRTSSFRHMMETGEGSESVIETLRNGLRDEIAADPANFEYELLRSEPILVELSVDQKNHGGTHLKVFFLVKVVRGQLRQEQKPDGPDTLLGPVKMADIEGVIMLTEGKTSPIHVRASKAALATLAVDKLVFNRYQNIVVSYQPRVLTSEEKSAVNAYSRRW